MTAVTREMIYAGLDVLLPKKIIIGHEWLAEIYTAMHKRRPLPDADKPQHEWLPISSAPKDGTPVVAMGNNYGDPAQGRHICIARWNVDEWWEYETDSRSPLMFLTHWAALPATPATPKEAICPK